MKELLYDFVYFLGLTIGYIQGSIKRIRKNIKEEKA